MYIVHNNTSIINKKLQTIVGGWYDNITHNYVPRRDIASHEARVLRELAWLSECSMLSLELWLLEENPYPLKIGKNYYSSKCVDLVSPSTLQKKKL